MSDINKVVLAYSGGLDTSVILKWLQDTYQCEVVTFTADIGQGEELEPARQKALQFGIKPGQIFIDDMREEFVRDFVFPMFRARAAVDSDPVKVPFRINLTHLLLATNDVIEARREYNSILKLEITSRDKTGFEELSRRLIGVEQNGNTP